jgi:hypothetical protein
MFGARFSARLVASLGKLRRRIYGVEQRVPKPWSSSREGRLTLRFDLVQLVIKRKQLWIYHVKNAVGIKKLERVLVVPA